MESGASGEVVDTPCYRAARAKRNFRSGQHKLQGCGSGVWLPSAPVQMGTEWLGKSQTALKPTECLQQGKPHTTRMSLDNRLVKLSLLGIGEASPETLCQIWFLQLERRTETLSKAQWQATNRHRVVEHMA